MDFKRLNMKKAGLTLGVLVIVLCLGFYVVFSMFDSSEEKTAEQTSTSETVEEKTEEKEEPVEDVSFTISFAGDCTLGNFAGQTYSGSFNQEYANQGNDATYFLRNVKDVFENDDLTVVNLEGPLTTATSHQQKTFPFSGPPEYVNILTSGSVEAVSVANNHSEDYYEQGFTDTKNTLNEAGVGYFGYEEYYTTEIKGIKCGFLGYRSMSLSMNNEEGHATIQNAINTLKEDEECQLVFVYYHWGIEGNHWANDDQRSLAHFTIDAGADAVIGSHPHVVQGTETYNDKPIVYSLGNFCFGGNRNPSDKDSMIYQLTYNFTGKEQTSYAVNIVPCRISSSTSRNNYQPTVLTGSEGERVLNKIQQYSY